MPRNSAAKSKVVGRMGGAFMMASEIIKSCQEMHECIVENSASAKDVQNLRDQLEKVQRDIENNEKKIQDELDKKIF